MQTTLLANTWVAAHLPDTVYMALLCCSGSAGEAAASNSLDEQFAEAGYQHLSIAPKHRRPPTYIVIGTALDETSAVRRIFRSGDAATSNPLLLIQARVQTNALVINIELNALSLDMSRIRTVTHLHRRYMFRNTNLECVSLPRCLHEFGEHVFHAWYQSNINRHERVGQR